jgi:ATP-dependent Lon protease
VLIPEENEKDLVDIPKAILRKLEVRAVSTIDQVLELALTGAPTPLPASAIEPKKAAEGEAAGVTTTH